MRLPLPALVFVMTCALSRLASGIIVMDADDAAFRTTPGDNSGWQYEGQFGSFLGTPVAPYYFLTAAHIGAAGSTFIFHGQTFTTTAYFDDSENGGTDLRLWKVSQPFAVYAPLYQEPVDAKGNAVTSEVNQALHVFGRGTDRGGEMYLNGALKGWAWGTPNGIQRWGRNTVTDVSAASSTTNPNWFFLKASFDFGAPSGEAHLSSGDSGGGVFILQDGLWRLAGINYGVDDLYMADGNTYDRFDAAIFDERGYYTTDPTGSGSPDPVTGTVNQPTSFYSTQVASRMAWIKSVVGGDPSALPTENFGNWQTAYFSPSDLQNPAVSGPAADPDGDGVTNLLEFAFNLDPLHPEPAVMTAATGLRGLPLIRTEQVAASDRRLTVEFVRRTAASGAGLTYTVQFTSNLGNAANWQAGGTSSVVAINPRWERVKVTDTVSASVGTPVRFARVSVTQAKGTVAP